VIVDGPRALPAKCGSDKFLSEIVVQLREIPLWHPTSGPDSMTHATPGRLGGLVRRGKPLGLLDLQGSSRDDCSRAQQPTSPAAERVGCVTVGYGVSSRRTGKAVMRKPYVGGARHRRAVSRQQASADDFIRLRSFASRPPAKVQNGFRCQVMIRRPRAAVPGAHRPTPMTRARLSGRCW
jgi:hypothetical protein